MSNKSLCLTEEHLDIERRRKETRRTEREASLIFFSLGPLFPETTGDQVFSSCTWLQLYSVVSEVVPATNIKHV